MGKFQLVYPSDNVWREPTGKKLDITHTAEPKLFRDLFPYTEVPRIPFDGVTIPLDPPDEMMITCTTFRDGQQARPPYTVNQIVAIYDFLHRLSGPNGVIRQCEFFLYSDKDKEAVRECLARGYRFPEVTGWIRAVEKDFQLVKEMGLKETGILTSASDYHIFLKLNSTREKAMEKYLALVDAALANGIIPRCHLEDITRADIYGFIVPFAQKLMERARQAKSKVKIRLCDTMGYGVPWSQAALPRSVPKLVRALTGEAGVPKEWLEWHGHNDFYLATSNAISAWFFGCSSINATVLGFGERTGNTPIEVACVTYAEITGSTNGMEMPVITELAEYFKQEIHYRIPHNTPLVGRDFNVTRAGIHADGAIKNEEIYNIFDTGTLLKRPPSVSVTDKSGIAGILYWIRTQTDLATDKLDKNHPGVVNLRDWVDELYQDGRTTDISSDEMIFQVKKHLPHLFKSEFDRIRDRVAAIALDLVTEMVTNPAIRSMDPARQEPVLEEYIVNDPFIKYLYITDTNGVKVTRNVVHPYDRAKYDKEFELHQDFSDRNWFVNPMKDGRAYITDFYISRFDRVLCITVSAPVRDEREEIIGVLGADIRFEDAAKLEEEEHSQHEE
ncbi:MAG: cache domain-containing protein [PVC group bacterium]